MEWIVLLGALVDVLKAIHEYVAEPSALNKEKLEDSLRKMRYAYQSFDEKMSQVERDLLAKNIEKVKTDIEDYDSKLDTSFNDVEEAADEILTAIERSASYNLSSYADSLIATTQHLRKTWMAFKQEVRCDQVDQAQNILEHVRHKIRHTH